MFSRHGGEHHAVVRSRQYGVLAHVVSNGPAERLRVGKATRQSAGLQSDSESEREEGGNFIAYSPAMVSGSIALARQRTAGRFGVQVSIDLEHGGGS